MDIIYARQPFPTTTTKSVFLAGPTPRNASVTSWRLEALLLLQRLGYDGTVFVPEHRDHSFNDWEALNYDEQVEWEEAALKRADCIVFWIPRNMETMPGLTTNVEFGVWQDSGKVVLGTPPGAQSVKYQQYYAKKLQVPVASTLADTLKHALDMVGSGAERTGGECQVPLVLWRHPSFQSWIKTQKAAGNRLDGCDLLWTFRAGKKREFTFAWVAHVNVYIASEDRNKVNEFAFGRTDISSVVMYRRPEDWYTMDAETVLYETEIVIIKEFRSPARTTDGFIWELTAGSSKDTDEATRSVAVHEVEEEAGVCLSPNRLRDVAARQLAGTLSVHQSTLFAVELTQEEMDEVKRNTHVVRGVLEDSERTYAHVFTVRQLLSQPLTDWSTMGMIFAALSPKF